MVTEFIEIIKAMFVILNGRMVRCTDTDFLSFKKAAMMVSSKMAK